MHTKREIVAESERSSSRTHSQRLLLLYTALLVIVVLTTLFLAAIMWHDTARFWLPEVLQGTVLLWLLATLLLGSILLLIVSRFTERRWLWWLSVVAAIALTVTISLILCLLWLLRET